MTILVVREVFPPRTGCRGLRYGEATRRRLSGEHFPRELS